jgi:hypothetical protein
MSMKITWLGLGLLCCAAVACGDDAGDGAACAPVVACGGDVVGTWEIESICISDDVADSFEAALPPECAGSFVRADTELSDATLEYTADGTLTSAGSATVSTEFRFSEACLLAISPDFPDLSDSTCAALADSTELELMADGTNSTATCQLGTGACECETTQQTSTAGSGSYTLNNNQIVVGPVGLPYCVSGDELRYESPMVGVATAHRR